MMHNRLCRLKLIVIMLLMISGAFDRCSVAFFSSVGHFFKTYNPGNVVYNLVDSYCTKNFGAQEADNWVIEKAHEFLNYCGVANASAIKIHKLEITGRHRSQNLDRLKAMTLLTGLWFNANLGDDDEALWYIAHESAHCALNHPWKNLLIKMRPAIVTGVFNAGLVGGMALLLNHDINSNRCFFSKMLSGLTKSMIVGLVSVPAVIEIYIQMIIAGLNTEKCFEREADLMAAKMLCDHGYAHVVKNQIETLSKYLEKGVCILHPYAHPSLMETRDYLQEFWNEWLLEHPEYVDVFGATDSPKTGVVE